MIQKSYIYIKNLQDGILEFEDNKFKGIKATELDFEGAEQTLSAIDRLVGSPKDIKVWLKG